MKCVLVTGATGFLGRHVTAALVGRGFSVHAVTRNTAAANHMLPPSVTIHQADLFATSSVTTALDKIRPSGLVHLAWEATPNAYWNSPANKSWKQASLELFRAFAAVGGTRIVVAGTSAEYDWNTLAPLDENTSAIEPASLYGSMKNLLRIELEKLAVDAGLTWAWGRLFNIFGPYEKPERLVPRTILSLLSGRRVHFDNARAVRDFMHVADAAAAFASLYESSFVGPLNVSSGEGITIRELLTAIATKMQCPEQLVFEEHAGGDGAPPYVVGSARRLHDILGWSERIGWQKGICQTVEWWRKSAA